MGIIFNRLHLAFSYFNNGFKGHAFKKVEIDFFLNFFLNLKQPFLTEKMKLICNDLNNEIWSIELKQ